MAEGEGQGDLVARALAQLVAERVRLPRRAALVVADESLYYALLPADAAWGPGEANARRYFEGALALRKLHVAVTLSPCGRHWLAVAMEPAVLEAVTHALAPHGVALGGVGAALFEDLDTLGRRMPASGAVVMARDQGVVLLQREAGGWTDLAWERCDAWQAETVAARVDALLYRHGRRSGAAARPSPVLLVAQRASQAARLAGLAGARGWDLCALRAPEAA
jgi:hypothetical protein